jgi:hypothetical protein
MNTIKIPLYFLIGVVTIVVTMFVISTAFPHIELIQTPTARFLANIIAIGAMVQSGIFSLLLIRQSDINRKNSDDTQERAEAFRNLQFVASNHTIIEFFDAMTMASKSARNMQRMKERMDFKFCLREEGIGFQDICGDIDGYSYVTINIPIKVVVGNAVSAVKFINFRLSREDSNHHFVPCCPDSQGLILWNEAKKRQELTFNLIVPKNNDFYNEDTVTPFTKIKVFLSMHSMLGVVVKGWTELYFTNPQKRERDGANKYQINSSQFRIEGLPELEGTTQVAIAKTK